MSCERTSSVLHAYLDGELDAAGAVEFERHLESCPDCAGALAAQRALRSSLRASNLRERAPETLRRRLEAELAAPNRRGPTQAPSANAWRALALAASFLLVVMVGWRQLDGLIGARNDPAISSIVDAHLRSLQPGHLIDVVSTDQHTVKPWFDGRIDFAPPVRDLATDGFPLEGGRLDVIRGRTVAVVVYARRKHVINVFVWPTTEKDTARSSGSHLGYNWVEWRKDGMESIAVSDVSAADLETVSQLLTN
ncbi:MAG TPA: anti-sigma factor [Candidatus Polarisedimenticolaceae bacterium]|nr:anti-sigma factor [Candidatus Polarisedimenticolaceae bacterium]